MILTSQNQEVHLHDHNRSLRYEPEPLSPDDSWNLFCKRHLVMIIAWIRVSNGVGKYRERDYKEMSGSSIGNNGHRRDASREEDIQWKRVLKSINNSSSKGQTEISEILALSYNDLPSHMKPCFLYFAFFPEDFEVRRKKLIQLWIAEGLIQQKGIDQTLEDVAADYLDELISQNMVQVAELISDECVKRC